MSDQLPHTMAALHTKKLSEHIQEQTGERQSGECSEE